MRWETPQKVQICANIQGGTKKFLAQICTFFLTFKKIKSIKTAFKAA